MLLEKNLEIILTGNKRAYGRLRGDIKHPLVVFVHGLTGHMDEHQFFNGARFLEKRGFSSFRFNLYGSQKNARKLKECSLKIHASDLDRVIHYLRANGSKKVFVVGHSYGGPTILMSKKKNFDGVVLWDPTSRLPQIFTKKFPVRYIKTLRAYIDKDAFDFLLGEKLVLEAGSMKNMEEKVAEIHSPIKFIYAEKSMLYPWRYDYYARANSPKALAVIKGADHGFSENGTEEKLLNETANWFKRILFSKI